MRAVWWLPGKPHGGAVVLETETEFSLSIEGAERQLCPFIDLAELVEAVELYYAGQLDRVDEQYFSRLYLNDWELIPGKSLLSVLDTATLRRCLMGISLEHRTVLNSYYGDTVAANTQMSKWCPPGMRLADYQSFLLPNAINELAFVVHHIL